MKDYTVRYIDKRGDYQDFLTVARDVKQAINAVLELCPDCRRVVRAIPSEMFEE